MSGFAEGGERSGGFKHNWWLWRRDLARAVIEVRRLHF